MVNERPGAVSVNNILGHQHPEQTPSTTYSVATSTRSRLRQQRTRSPPAPGADSVNNALGHQHPGQPPSSTSLGANSIVNVLSQQYRPGQPPSSTYVSTASVRQKDS